MSKVVILSSSSSLVISIMKDEDMDDSMMAIILASMVTRVVVSLSCIKRQKHILVTPWPLETSLRTRDTAWNQSYIIVLASRKRTRTSKDTRLP